MNVLSSCVVMVKSTRVKLGDDDMFKVLQEATPFLEQIGAKSLDFQKLKSPVVEFCEPNTAVVSVCLLVKVNCEANAMLYS